MEKSRQNCENMKTDEAELTPRPPKRSDARLRSPLIKEGDGAIGRGDCSGDGLRGKRKESTRAP